MGWGKFKPLLTDSIVSALEPVRSKYNEIMTDKTYLDSVLKQGKEKAELVANQTLQRVKDGLGYLSINN